MKNSTSTPSPGSKKPSACEIREDPVSGTRVIIAESRAARPQWTQGNPPAEAAPLCPFCPGQEHLTPPGREYFPDDQQAWQVRVVPNLYPAVEWPAPQRNCGYQPGADPASGTHEVIIETPEHVETMTRLSQAQVEKICWVYRDRLQQCRHDPRVRAALLFKNVGLAAGASLPHLHSQIMALPQVPTSLENELRQCRQHWQTHGTCLFCDLLRNCPRSSPRHVYQGEHLVACTPFAPRFAYETWILPRDHHSAFDTTHDGLLIELASLLPRLLLALETIHPQVSYNYYLHSAPFDRNCHHYYHWHIEVFPRTHYWAGFEMGSGCIVNPVSPETAARDLRQQLS